MDNKLHLKIATDQLQGQEGNTPQENELQIEKWKSLFSEERHREQDPALLRPRIDQWRMRDRMKTVSVALVVCLNIGVDPPDVIKTTPCARLECWVDPHALPPQKAVDTIGKTLQMQYERWQPRARYKLCLDPTVEAVKKLCGSLRRSAKEERTLFHYNGHGVPKPTDNGEIWVFNKDYTQYIPLSIYDLQQWLGSPSIYVFDCNCAGLIIKWFNKFVDQRQNEREKQAKSNPASAFGASLQEDHILLAACGATETLPTNPDLPADIFTSCLTTPIKMALKWFVSQTIISGVTLDLIDHIPGRLNDRRTPLGELNWIFTAVTDTIAWNVLPRHLFQKLFRQDLLVACLFRNFLLAERIMRSCRCTPISVPKLPPTYNHPMWQAWDLAADYCLAQLPKLIANPNTEFKHCTFFTEQLTAFEVWLEFGTEDKQPPEQLPIVLQVLLSQQHRLRALVLLGKFLDLGPWAVNQGLSVGIFPYVLKLLQSPAPELREILVFIWAKILAVDKSCRTDLVKENGQVYFLSILSNTSIPATQRTQTAFILSVICQKDSKTNSSSSTSGSSPSAAPNSPSQGQTVCLGAKLIQICLTQLNDPNPQLRRWVVFCLAKLWENYEEAKERAIREGAHEKLCALLTDPVPEVRAAAVYALGTFIGGDPTIQRSEQRSDIEFNLGVTLPVVTGDSSPMVRRELAIALANLVRAYHDHFVEEVKRQLRAEYSQFVRKRNAKAGKDDPKSSTSSHTPANKSSDSISSGLTHSGGQSNSSSIAGSPALATSPSGASEASLLMAALAGNVEEPTTNDQSGVYDFIWKIVRSLAADPVSNISSIAQHVVTHVRNTAQQQHIQTLNAVGTDTSQYMDALTIRKSTMISPSEMARGNRSPAKRDLASSQSHVPSGNQLGTSKLAQSANALSSQQLTSSSSSSNLAAMGSSSTSTTPKKSTNSSSRMSGLANLLPLRSSKKESKESEKSSSSGAQAASDDSNVDRNSGEGDDYTLGLPHEEISSSLYEWACLSFSSPIMRPNEEDETAPDYSERRWRQQRNEHLIREANLMFSDKTSMAAVPRKLDQEIAMLENDCQLISLMLFHPFEPIIVVADEARGISVWNWEEGSRMNKIDNKNYQNSRISSLSLLNEHDMALIAAGSDDGVVRIWSGLYGSSKMVTAWRVLSDVPPLTRHKSAGLILDWQQQNELLLATGNVNVIRVWDLNRELSIQDIPTLSDTAVTCLTSDKTEGGRTVFAGFADGTVRVYDTRQSGTRPTATFSELRGNPIVSVSRPQSSNCLVTGSTVGVIKFWDPKQANSVNTIGTPSSSSVMQALAVHDQAPILATGSQDQRIKVMSFKGEEISLIRYHDGFLGQRIGPVSCLAFHPYHILLGAGAADSLVSIYAGESFKSTAT